MKVNSEKNDEEANDSLETSYSVEPGYVKQMIDRFSSVLPNGQAKGAGDEGMLFKVPLLHSTRTKTHEPFQYPVLLANRSAVPVKTTVTVRGTKAEVSKKNTDAHNSNCKEVSSSHFNNHKKSRKNESDMSSLRHQSPHRQNNHTPSDTNIHQSKQHKEHTADKHESKDLQRHNADNKEFNHESHHLQYSPQPCHSSTTTAIVSEQTIKPSNSLHLDLSSSPTHVTPLSAASTNGESALDDALGGFVPAGDENKGKKIQKDGHYFLSLMAQKGREMLEVCEQFQAELSEPKIDEGVLGKIRAALGKSNLLLSKKFKQFDDLCAANLTCSESEQFQVTCADLEGFWDMVLIQVADVEASFEELRAIKRNDWKDLSTSPSSFQSPTSKHPPCQHRLDNSAPSVSKASKLLAKLPSSKPGKTCVERRSGLQAAIKAGRRQRKTSQSDEVLIFMPEKTH